jgi:hypothetical protein
MLMQPNSLALPTVDASAANDLSPATWRWPLPPRCTAMR